MDLEERLSVLQKEKQRLSTELAECKADKEFVWLLWKQLQSTSPDVSSAIGMVVTREKEKTERKDRKVLEILQAKDARINQLETYLLDKTEEQKHHQKELQAVQAAHQVEVLQFESEMNAYRKQLEESNETVRMLREELVEQRKKFESDLQGRQQEVETTKTSNSALVSQLTESKTEYQALSTRLTEERNSYAQEIQSANQVASDVQARCRQLEGKNRELKKDCQRSCEKINELTEVVRRLQIEDEHKNSQVSELRSIVTDAERISNECRIALEVEKELHRKSLQKLDETSKQGQAAYSEFQQILQEAQQRHAKELAEKSCENAELKVQLTGGDGVDRETQTDGYEFRDSSTSPLKMSHITSQLPISTSPSTLQFERQMTDMQIELENTKETLNVKMQELREVKSAHTNRLKRLQDLQMNYRLVLEQLKTYEEGDLVQSPDCLNLEKKWLPRASVKELQQEDSDTVWNELSHCKTQNRALQTKRVVLEEECDVLRVRVAEQLSTIHDLRDCLKTEKDELTARLQLSETETAAMEISLDHDESDHFQVSDKQTEALQASILLLEEDKQKLITDQCQQQEECFQLREELAKVKAHLLHSQLDACHVAVQCAVIESTKATMTDLRGLDMSLVSLRHRPSQTDGEVQTICTQQNDWKMSNVDSSLTEKNRHCQSIGTQASIQLEDREIQTEENTDQQHPINEKHMDRQQHFRSKSAGTVFAFGSHFVPPRLVKRRGTTKSLKAGERVVLLQQRVASLTRQLSVVQKAKQDTDTALEEQRLLYEQLEKDHQLCPPQSCPHQPHTVQLHDPEPISQLLSQIYCQITAEHVLQTELDAQRTEKAQLQQRLSEVLSVHAQQMAVCSASNSTISTHSETEWKQLEHRAKSTSEECVRQGRFIKSLKSELQTQEEQSKRLLEKCSRLEHDVGRKQGLIEDIKSRLKNSRDEAESLSKKLKIAEEKLESAEEAHEQRKSRLQGLKNRLSHEVEERDKLLHLYHSIQAEMDKRSQECEQLKGRLRRSETAIAHVAERARQFEQLKEEAHGKALAVVEKKLERAGKHLEEYRAFVKAFTEELIQQVQEAKQLSRALDEKRVSHSAPEIAHVESSRSWAQTKQISCSILNISDAEFAEFMHPSEAVGSHDQVCEVEDHEDNSFKKKERSWWKKAVKLANSQPPFAVALMELFLSIMDERLQFLTLQKTRL